jgi:hypothetical protein
MDNARKNRILQKVAMGDLPEDVSIRPGMGWGHLAKGLSYGGGWKKLRDEVVGKGGSPMLHPGQKYGYDAEGTPLMRSGARMPAKAREVAAEAAKTPASYQPNNPPAVVTAPPK